MAYIIPNKDKISARRHYEGWTLEEWQYMINVALFHAVAGGSRIPLFLNRVAAIERGSKPAKRGGRFPKRGRESGIGLSTLSRAEHGAPVTLASMRLITLGFDGPEGSVAPYILRLAEPRCTGFSADLDRDDDNSADDSESAAGEQSVISADDLDDPGCDDMAENWPEAPVGVAAEILHYFPHMTPAQRTELILFIMLCLASG